MQPKSRLDTLVSIPRQSDQSFLNLRQHPSDIAFIQPNVMPMQNVKLWRGVTQNLPQHSVPKPELLTHGCHQLSQVMQHEAGRTQPHRHTVNVFIRNTFERKPAKSS